MDAETTVTQHVFGFAEGDGKDKKLLGGKGANLCEMTQIGLNVPPGFVISTAACLEYLASASREMPAGVMDEVHAHMRSIEEQTGKGFGDADNPLLVSVRSGSAMSMPGMMDTILNLGLNSATLQGVIAQTGDRRFGYDAYRRFIQLFGKVALGVSDELFDKQFDGVKKKAGVKEDLELSADDLREISERFLKVVEEATGRPFPEDPYVQLEIAVKAVFNSWMGKRAVDYRKQFHITPDMANGTAVNVQTMVFGNRGDDCATGVAFTRNPGTGENKLSASTWSTPRARTWWPASARPSPSTGWRRRCRRWPRSWRSCATSWRRTTGRSRTSSSPSRAVGSSACRPATAR